LSTTDFNLWSLQNIAFGDRNPEYLEGISYGNGHWVTVSPRHLIWSSSDGETWDDAFTTGMNFPGDRFYDVTFDGDSFWTCGASGALLQSKNIVDGGGERGPVRLSIRRGAPGSVVLVIDGRVDDEWDLMFSPVLPATSWELRNAVTLIEAPTEVTEPVGASGRGFYQLQESSGP